MSALDRLKARLELFHAQGEGADKTDKNDERCNRCGAASTSDDYCQFCQSAPLGSEKISGRGSAEPAEALADVPSPCVGRAGQAFAQPAAEISRHPPPANDDGEPLEPVGIVLDEAGDPAVSCGTCGGHSFHQAPGAPWRCSGCEPPTLPDDAAALAGWAFCSLPPDDPAQDGPPGTAENPQDADSALARPWTPPTADAPPDAPPTPWTDDRAWITRWRTAGPILADRLPVAEAWSGRSGDRPGSRRRHPCRSAPRRRSARCRRRWRDAALSRPGAAWCRASVLLRQPLARATEA